VDQRDPFAALDAAIAAAGPQERGGLVVALSARLAALGAGLAQAPQPAAASAPDENVDVEEGARRLGVSVRFVYRHQRDLPVVRVGRRVLLSSRGIDRFIAQRAGRHA
jgi:excisionase family DNA binding protein